MGSAAWSITNLRRVCQLVPTNYEGSFESADALLTRIWYTGAYTVKITQVEFLRDSSTRVINTTSS